MTRMLLIGSALALAAGCTSGPPAAEAPPPAADYLSVPEAQLSKLEMASVATVPWETVVRTTGVVDFNADSTTQAIPQVSGPITRIVADTGTRVHAGDPLMYVMSAEMADAVSTYRKAKNRLDLARRTLDRDKDLFDHKAIAQRDLESSQADYNDASTDVQASLEALRVFNVSPEDLADAEHQDTVIRPQLAVRAPISGAVVQKFVLPGQVVEAGAAPAFVISDMSTVWVQGNLYERDLASVHIGDRVDIDTPALGETFRGTVSYIGAVVDPATRTTPVRITTRNTDGALKKDLFVDLTIRDSATKNVLAVPVTAVLYDEQNLPFVYVQMSPGKFAQRHITLGAQANGRFEVRDGLREGDPVVAQGSIFLQFASTYQQ
jgi:cobalt-zinc-cadmium efflux system membrane fusion protein